MVSSTNSQYLSVTGGARYVPGTGVESSDPQLNAFQDPFTGITLFVVIFVIQNLFRLQLINVFYVKTGYFLMLIRVKL